MAAVGEPGHTVPSGSFNSMPMNMDMSVPFSNSDLPITVRGDEEPGSPSKILQPHREPAWFEPSTSPQTNLSTTPRRSFLRYNCKGRRMLGAGSPLMGSGATSFETWRHAPRQHVRIQTNRHKNRTEDVVRKTTNPNRNKRKRRKQNKTACKAVASHEPSDHKTQHDNQLQTPPSLVVTQ